MPMTVVVTRDVPSRFRGFLASCMCEIAPGVYTAPRMNRSVRERVWSVLEEWWLAYPDASILMTWPDSKLPGGQSLRTLGTPRLDLHSHHGVFLARRAVDSDAEAGNTGASHSTKGSEPSSGDAHPSTHGSPTVESAS